LDDVDLLPIRPEQISQTRRYRKLKKFDDYYHSTQYKGRPDFWKGEDANGDVVPLRERAPCIIYPLPKACVNQATRFTLGEGRFPTIRIEPVEVTDEEYGNLALSKEEAELLTSYCAQIIDQACLRANMRTLMRRGMSSGTAVPIMGLRNGKFCVDMPHAHDTWPVFTAGHVGDVEKLTICYQFDKLLREGNELKYEKYYHRRDVDMQQYIVYHDVKVEPGLQKSVRWSVDEAATITHNLGFCPAVWCRNLADPYSSDIDGVSLFDGLLSEFDSLNFALSQRHRGIVFFGVPQPWETGVRQNDGPMASGRTAKPKGGDQVDPFHVQTAPARKAGPDQVWRYENEKALVGLMETTGKSFDAATKHVTDIRERLLEAMDIVLLDQMKVTGSGDISAKALALMYAPLLALVDELRECWWTHGLKQLLSMALRMVAVTGGAGVMLPRSAEVATIVQRFLVDEMWIPPKMIPIWGDYFSPLNSEILEAVNTANMALQGGLISHTTAANYVGSYFGVEDVQREMVEIEKEKPEELGQVPGEPAVVKKPKEPAPQELTEE